MKTFFILGLGTVASSFVIPDRSQLVPSTFDPKEEELREAAPGIGVEFATSYATAAIRYHNGTVRNLVKVQASQDYIDLVARWSSGTSPIQRACAKEQRSRFSNFRCKLVRTYRHLRKQIGRPATSEVGTIASLLGDVKSAVEERLNMKIGSVQPVFPFLESLNEQDITDALQYAGLHWPPTSKHPHHVYAHTNAAYAGLGYGLCSSWQSTEQCRREEEIILPQRTLFLTFDNSSFEAIAQPTQDPYTSWVEVRVAESDLGWWSLPVDEIPRAKFWGKMHEAILSLGYENTRDLSMVILLGDHAHDREFQDTVKAALGELLESDVSTLLKVNRRTNGTMLAAQGAAEMAFRAQWLYEQQRKEPYRLGEQVVEL